MEKLLLLSKRKEPAALEVGSPLTDSLDCKDEAGCLFLFEVVREAPLRYMEVLSAHSVELFRHVCINGKTDDGQPSEWYFHN